MTRGLPAALFASLMWLAACGGSPTSPPPIVTPPVVQPPVVEPPPPPPPPAPAVPVLAVAKILAFGDSMTEGVDSPPLPSPYAFALDWSLPLDAGRASSYPYKLKKLIEARYSGQSVVVYNGGLAGRQAREDRDRFNAAMSAAKPDIILLMEGANDLNADLAAGEGINARVTAVVSALEDMVRDGGGRGIPVFVATIPPQRPGGPKAWGVDLVPRFNDAVEVMAGKKDAVLVDVGQLPLSLIGQDGLHPTEAGYQRIAEIWLEAIKARYEKQN